jgi:YggT family protein
MLLGLLQFIDVVLNLIIFIIIAQVIVSWLLAFNILNMSNQFVAMVANALYSITEPLLRPIRRLVPNFGGLDISPIILFLAIYFIRLVILYPLMREVAMGNIG